MNLALMESNKKQNNSNVLRAETNMEGKKHNKNTSNNKTIFCETAGKAKQFQIQCQNQ